MMVTWKAMDIASYGQQYDGDHVNHSITANECIEKTHFGRIDYLDQEKGGTVSLYIELL